MLHLRSANTARIYLQWRRRHCFDHPAGLSRRLPRVRNREDCARSAKHGARSEDEKDIFAVIRPRAHTAAVRRNAEPPRQDHARNLPGSCVGHVRRRPPVRCGVRADLSAAIEEKLQKLTPRQSTQSSSEINELGAVFQTATELAHREIAAAAPWHR